MWMFNPSFLNKLRPSDTATGAAARESSGQHEKQQFDTNQGKVLSWLSAMVSRVE
jgi:hypothetical protein